jgi:septation ring formation regulator EzrA
MSDSILQPVAGGGTSAENTPPSVEARQNWAKRQTEAQARHQYQQLCEMQKRGIQQMWHNNSGLTPQQFIDAFGNKGAKMLALHAALTECIVKIAAVDGVTPGIELPTHAFTANADGTVTILETPYGV